VLAGPQVESDEPIVRQSTPELRTQVMTELRVVVEPPEGWPSKYEKVDTGAAHAFQFADGREIVFWIPPVLTVSFEEREGPSSSGNHVLQFAFVN
jgi:hypothetical protein